MYQRFPGKFRVIALLGLWLSMLAFPANAQVWFLREGIHTEVIVEAGLVGKHLPAVSEQFDSAHALKFGWGDLDYFSGKQRNAWITGKALMLPTRSIVKVQPYDAAVVREGLLKLSLSAAEKELLMQKIAQSFKRDKQGNIRFYKTTERGSYYRARGAYFLFNTCNNWTAKMLKSAGLRVGVRRSILAGGLQRRVKKAQRKRLQAEDDLENTLQRAMVHESIDYR